MSFSFSDGKFWLLMLGEKPSTGAISFVLISNNFSKNRIQKTWNITITPTTALRINAQLKTLGHHMTERERLFMNKMYAPKYNIHSIKDRNAFGRYFGFIE